MAVIESMEDRRRRLSLEANIPTEREMGGDRTKKVRMRGIVFKGDRAFWGICFFARIYVLFTCFIQLLQQPWK